MNLDYKEKRLNKLLEDNIREGKVGTAIEITGSWGVGKTYFWNNFFKKVTKKEIEDKRGFYYEVSRMKYGSIFEFRKYAYISLFGIENLSDLKNAICTKLTLNPYAKTDDSNLSFNQLFKNTIAQFKDMKVSQYGVSASARIIESLLFLQVKDAIICFDDFERMSNKLDIKDVMGLANQLKLEKNCQVILILDESRTEEQNKEKYAEYKEKLIDETIKITSVEPLIRANTNGIDDELVGLMVKFAEVLEIHNFRFFQKVIKLYSVFRSQLPDVVADSTKEIILIRIIQGYFIEDFGEKYQYSWDDIKYFSDEKQKDWPNIKKNTYEKIQQVSFLFIHEDKWLIEFKEWFDQLGEPDFSKLHELANSELITDKNNQLMKELENLMKEWRNLNINPSFCDRLFSTAKEIIAIDNLENLSFYCDLLNEFGEPLLACELQKSIEEYLLNEYQSKGYLFVNDHFSFGYKSENRFHIFLKSLQEKQPHQGFHILIDVIHGYIFNNGFNSNTDSFILKNATKTDWHNLIFHDITINERFKESNKFQILRKILDQQISVDLQPQINTLIFEVLEEEAQASTVERRKNIEYVIKRLKE